MFAVTARFRIGRIIAFPSRAFHRVCAYIGVFRAIAGLNTLGAVGRQLALARHPAIRFIRRTAGCARRKRSAYAGLIRTLIGAGALLPIAATGSVCRVIAFSICTLHGIRTHIGVFRTIAGLGTLGTIRRQFALTRHAAIGLVRRAAHRTGCKRPAHAGFIRTLVRVSALFPIGTNSRVRGISTFSIRTGDGIRTDIGIFFAVTRLETFRAIRRQFAFARHAAIGLVRRTAGNAGSKRAAHAGFIRALVRVRTLIPVTAANRIGRIIAFAGRAFHRVCAYIGVFHAITGLNTLGAVGRQLAFARHPAIRFIRRTAGGARSKGPADTGFIRALIRFGALIAVRTAGRVRRVIALAGHALHRIRANAGIFETIRRLNTIRAFVREFALARHAAVRLIRRTARGIRRKRPAHTSFVGALIRAGALIAVTTASRIRRIIAFAGNAFHRIRTNIGVFRAVAVLITLRAIRREFTLARHAAIGFIRRAARRIRCEWAADASFVGALIRARALIAVTTAGRIRRIIAFAGNTFHRIRTNIGVFRAVAILIALRTIGRHFTLAGHPAVGFIRRAAGRARCKRAAHTSFIGALIRACALIAVRAASCVRRIIALAGNTFHRIRTNIGVFGAVAVLITFRTIGRQFALAGHAAIGFIRGAARRARCKRPAHTGFIGTLIRAGALIAVRAAGRIRRVVAFP